MAARASQVLSLAKSLPMLPIISRSGSEDEGDSHSKQQQQQQQQQQHAAADGADAGMEYALTPEEERLVQACQGSINSAGALGVSVGVVQRGGGVGGMSVVWVSSCVTGAGG